MRATVAVLVAAALLALVASVGAARSTTCMRAAHTTPVLAWTGSALDGARADDALETLAVRADALTVLVFDELATSTLLEALHADGASELAGLRAALAAGAGAHSTARRSSPEFVAAALTRVRNAASAADRDYTEYGIARSVDTLLASPAAAAAGVHIVHLPACGCSRRTCADAFATLERVVKHMSTNERAAFAVIAQSSAVEVPTLVSPFIAETFAGRHLLDYTTNTTNATVYYMSAPVATGLLVTLLFLIILFIGVCCTLHLKTSKRYETPAKAASAQQ